MTQILKMKEGQMRSIDVSDDSESVQAQQAFFSRHTFNNMTMIIQINNGFMHLAYNLLCSLRRLNPEFIKGIVLWTVDDKSLESLRTYKADSFERAQMNPSLASFSGFGVYSFADAVVTSSFERGGSEKYNEMMGKRPKFFLHLLKTVKIDFLFVDADNVFMRDPWFWIEGESRLKLAQFSKHL